MLHGWMTGARCLLLIGMSLALPACSKEHPQEASQEAPVDVSPSPFPEAEPPATPDESTSGTAELEPLGPVIERTDWANRYAVIIGVHRYRKPWARPQPARAAAFAKIPARLQVLAGFPEDHLLFLGNENATQADIIDAVLGWLPDRINGESIVFFYVSGRTIAAPQSGEVFLMPYEGTPSSSPEELISIHALQGTLKRMEVKLCILFLETPLVESSGASGSGNPRRVAPDWRGVIRQPQNGRPVRLVQIATAGNWDGRPGGLATSLRGRADKNGDGRVTLGEFLDDARQIAAVYPVLPPGTPERDIHLTGGP